MATNEKVIELSNRVKSIKSSDNPEVNHIIAGADDIYDDNKKKKQSQINTEVEEAIGADNIPSSIKGRIKENETALAENGSVDQRIEEEGAKHYLKTETYNKTELNNMITTPNQEYVTLVAESGDTLSDIFDGVTGAADTTYRVGNWDGSANSGAGGYDVTVYSEYAYDGTNFVHLSTKTQVGEVFDISAYHATGGILATYVDLSAALDSNNGGGVPQSLQRGGMSVKYVRTYDHKYVQYRLMSDLFNTTPSNWQGVDEELKSGSHNLIENAAVVDKYASIVCIQAPITDGYYITANGPVANAAFSYTDYIPVVNKSVLWLYNTIKPIDSAVQVLLYDDNKSYIASIALNTQNLGINQLLINSISSVRYIRTSFYTNQKHLFFIGIDYSGAIINQSENIAGIASDVNSLKNTIGNVYHNYDLTALLNQTPNSIDLDGKFVPLSWSNACLNFVNCEGVKKIYTKLRTDSSHLEIAFYSDSNQSSFISGKVGTGSINEAVVDVPSNAKYFRASTTATRTTCYIIASLSSDLTNDLTNVKSKISTLETTAPRQFIEGPSFGSTAIGDNSQNNNIGKGNTSLGYKALMVNDHQSDEEYEGQVNDTGYWNTAIGSEALFHNTYGDHNTAVGMGAGHANTTGSGNTYIGQDTAFKATTGNRNTCVGRYAGMEMTTGDDNVMVGLQAGVYGNSGLTSGNRNVLVGNNAGLSVGQGNDNVAIGYFARPSGITNPSNTIAIGSQAAPTKNNSCRIGGTSLEVVETYGDYYVLTNGGGIILKSPNGTPYKITVSNNGELIVTVVS